MGFGRRPDPRGSALTAGPNFFIIGAPRAGTTSLYTTLGAHPDVFVTANKEPWYYAVEGRREPFSGPGDGRGVTDRDAYRALFAGSDGFRAIGEASTLYLSSPQALQRIAGEVPDARIVVALRQPVDRAYSAWKQHRWQGREPLDFEAALVAGPERVEAGWAPFWDYAAMSRYGRDLARWTESFASVHVCWFDDLMIAPEPVYRDVLRFLAVDPNVAIDPSRRENQAALPRSAVVNAVVRNRGDLKRAAARIVPAGVRGRLRSWVDRVNRSRTPLDPSTRKRLTPSFSDDIDLVEELTGRNLDAWRLSP